MVETASLIPNAEFRLSPAAFTRIRELMFERAGIELANAKRNLVYGRLARRLRALKLHDFDAYLALVEDPRSAEAQHFLNALTTNVTSFFREPHHFEYLSEQIAPELARRAAAGERLRLWSAGCSSGEEPYTIAITLLSAGLEPAACDFKILATDIDSQVLATASRGVYAEERVEKLPHAQLRRFFRAGRGANAGSVRVADSLRALVSFRRLNLMQPWPVRGPFDAIFCRNVIIYFDGPTRATLVKRFAELLRPGGHLFLGHSESLVGSASPALEARGRTIYSKRAQAAP